jgi:hypothetical protein
MFFIACYKCVQSLFFITHALTHTQSLDKNTRHLNYFFHTPFHSNTLLNALVFRVRRVFGNSSDMWEYSRYFIAFLLLLKHGNRNDGFPMQEHVSVFDNIFAAYIIIVIQ